MTLNPKDEIRATAMLHHGAARQSFIALLLLQYRPQALARPRGAAQLADLLMAQFRGLGWESPLLMLRGGHLAAAGHIDVYGATDPASTRVTLTHDGGDIAYQGPVDRDPLWCAMAANAGSIGVLVGADPALDDLGAFEDLESLAEQGKLLAGNGRLQSRPGSMS